MDCSKIINSIGFATSTEIARILNVNRKVILRDLNFKVMIGDIKFIKFHGRNRLYFRNDIYKDFIQDEGLEVRERIKASSIDN